MAWMMFEKTGSSENMTQKGFWREELETLLSCEECRGCKHTRYLLRYPCDSFCIAVIGQSLCVNNNCFSCATSFFSMETSF